MDKADKLPKRKQIRLRKFEYDSNGAYFITFCTKDRKKVLSEVVVGTTIGRPPEVVLTEYGRVVEEAILTISQKYPTVNVDHYVIMPNHVHLLLFLFTDDGRPMVVPTVSRIIQQLKGYITKRIGHSIWQSRFYDRVIRNYREYNDTWLYIDNNPAHRAEDEYC